MATAKKTPSGMWKVRVYSHTTPDGKKHYKAFTAATKQEAEQQAARFAGTADRASRSDLTVKEAVTRYIDAKEGVLSPSTVRAYKIMRNHCFDEIGTMRIRRLTTEQVQTFVSHLAADKSPKYVRNIYALFVAAVAMYAPDITFRVTLPQKQRKRRYAMSNDDVTDLIEAAPDWMKIAIMLAGFGSCRRGECCALKYGDIAGEYALVHADVVLNSDGAWVYKEMPKTCESYRYIHIHEQAVPLIEAARTGDPDQFILGKTPGQVSDTFDDLRKELGLDVTFHDLRRFYASTCVAIGIPQAYTEHSGGWRPGSPVVRESYEHPIRAYEEQFTARLSDHFNQILKK